MFVLKIYSLEIKYLALPNISKSTGAAFASSLSMKNLMSVVVCVAAGDALSECGKVQLRIDCGADACGSFSSAATCYSLANQPQLTLKCQQKAASIWMDRYIIIISSHLNTFVA